MKWTRQKPQVVGHWLFFSLCHHNDETGYTCVTHVRIEIGDNGRLYARGNCWCRLLCEVEGWWCRLEWPPAGEGA